MSIITNFLAFFNAFFPQNFLSWIRIHSPVFLPKNVSSKKLRVSQILFILFCNLNSGTLQFISFNYLISVLQLKLKVFCYFSTSIIINISLRKTFYLFRKILLLLRSHKPSTLVGGKNIVFCPPLPYLWFSAHADHLILWIQMTGCFTKQLLAGNLYYRLENSCYTYSSLPGNLSCTSL